MQTIHFSAFYSHWTSMQYLVLFSLIFHYFLNCLEFRWYSNDIYYSHNILWLISFCLFAQRLHPFNVCLVHLNHILLTDCHNEYCYSEKLKNSRGPYHPQYHQSMFYNVYATIRTTALLSHFPMYSLSYTWTHQYIHKKVNFWKHERYNNPYFFNIFHYFN